MIYWEEGSQQTENQESIILWKKHWQKSVASNNLVGRPCAYCIIALGKGVGKFYLSTLTSVVCIQQGFIRKK